MKTLIRAAYIVAVLFITSCNKTESECKTCKPVPPDFSNDYKLKMNDGIFGLGNTAVRLNKTDRKIQVDNAGKTALVIILISIIQSGCSNKITLKYCKPVKTEKIRFKLANSKQAIEVQGFSGPFSPEKTIFVDSVIIENGAYLSYLDNILEKSCPVKPT